MHFLTPFGRVTLGALAFAKHNQPRGGRARRRPETTITTTTRRRVQHHSSDSSIGEVIPIFSVADQDSQAMLPFLCDLLQVAPPDRLCLRTTEDDVRGVFLNAPSANDGDLLLKIPLSSCLRDDDPPEWLSCNHGEASSSELYPLVGNGLYSAGSEWATRLAARVLDLQLSPESEYDEGIQRWLTLLPDSILLRASLPIHWPDDIRTSCQCTALELAVDAAYFARAEVIQDLMSALQRSPYDVFQYDDLERMCHNALDIVQTRCCKVDVPGSDTPVRLLAPVFDMINHGSGGEFQPNALYQVEESHLVVRATRAIGTAEQVLIDYGEASAGTPWKCLVFYGFVPGTDEHTKAEVVVDGVRSEVCRDSVPMELVEAAAAALQREGNVEQFAESTANPLSASVALRIAEQALNAYENLVDFEVSLSGELDETSLQLASSLRNSQRAVLSVWATGLKDYARRITGSSK